MSIVEATEPDVASKMAYHQAWNEDGLPEQAGSQASASAKKWVACGLFLLVLGVYVIASPGRMDSVDGQARFDVAYNLATNGRPILTDHWIGPGMGVRGRDGFLYSYYGAPASVFGMPLVWIGQHLDPSSIQTSHFLFSLTSPIFGAGIAVILFLFYIELGFEVRTALVWTIVSSFATYIWPISMSVLDNAQHAFFTIAAVYFAFISLRRRSVTYAVVGGLMGGLLVLYQNYFLLICPFIAVAVMGWKSSARPAEQFGGHNTVSERGMRAVTRGFLSVSSLLREAWNKPGESRSACVRYAGFLGGVATGVVLTLVYNHARFGAWLDDGKARIVARQGFPLFGNPLAGFLTLLVSPGKSVLLYSPALILGILGIRQLYRRAPELVVAIGASSAVLVLFISSISFAGGDWCWGPRYLTPLFPLWALAFPYSLNRNLRRDIVVAIIALGCLVQVMALTVESHRFFFEKALDDYFWAEDQWCYFKHSAIFSRVGEIASLSEPLPATAKWFSSTPKPEWMTYCILGTPPNIPRRLSPMWMRYFKIYYLPRPWPLWMSWLPASARPINIGRWLLALLGLIGVGGWSIYYGLQKKECE